jgi:hypothetical protein
MSMDITSLLSTATVAITLAAGDYSIASNVTVPVDLTIESGAVITVPTGVTLTFARDLVAPRSRIFQGAGSVDMNHSRIATAWPEWWGAKVNDGAFDSLAALTAAVAAHPTVELVAGDYYISSTWKITKGHRTVRGAGSRWSPTLQGTRIIVTSATADTMQVGTDTMPPTINDFLIGVHVSRIGLWRSVVPQKPPAGQPVNGAAGLRAQYLLSCRFDEVYAEQHIVCFNIGGCVGSWFEHCYAFRSVAGSGSGSDAFHGYYLNGNTIPAGAAGGNASVYLTDCGASLGGAPAIPIQIGLGLDGSFADTFVTRFETASIAKGITIYGVSTNPDPARRKVGNLDLHIVLPVLDQCADRCIEMGNLSDYALVEIVDPYLACANGALAAIHIHDGGGNVHLLGGQMIGFGDAESGGNALGILAERQAGLRVTGAKLLGFKRPIALDTCTRFDVAADVSNPGQSGSQAAVYLAACDRGRVTPFVRGQSGAFPQGVNLAGSGNAHVMVDLTGIDPACITGGATNKLVINGTPISATGATGTHFVTGVTS